MKLLENTMDLDQLLLVWQRSLTLSVVWDSVSRSWHVGCDNASIPGANKIYITFIVLDKLLNLQNLNFLFHRMKLIIASLCFSLGDMTVVRSGFNNESGKNLALTTPLWLADAIIKTDLLKIILNFLL